MSRIPLMNTKEKFFGKGKKSKNPKYACTLIV